VHPSARLGGSVEPGQHTLYLVNQIRTDLAAVAALEETPQSAMPESAYHAICPECKLTIVCCLAVEMFGLNFDGYTAGRRCRC
jgi:hypothetical protein